MRFSVFNGEWICTSLSKISYSLEYGIGASAVDYDGQHRYIRITDISNYSDNERNFVSPSFLDNKAILKEGDILLARTGATVGDSFIFKSECDYNAYYAGFLIRARIRNNNPYFIYYQLKTDRYNKWVKIMSARSGQPGINSQEYGSFAINLPSIQEQDKIALLLRKIDMRIETQNKIIDKLESLRVQIKERIFDLGSIKKTISDVLIENNKKSNIQDQYPVLSSTVKGLFLQSDYFDREVASSDNIGYKIVKKGQIIISPQNLWMGNITYNDSFEYGIVSPSYKVFDIKEAYSKIYIYWLLTSKHSLFNYGLVSEQGASIVRRNLNYDSFLSITLPLCNEEQQKHISKLIKSIEAKLKIEKQRAELFAKQKNYLLSNLFI